METSTLHIPSDLYHALESLAEKQHRNVDDQAISLLKQHLMMTMDSHSLQSDDHAWMVSEQKRRLMDLFRSNHQAPPPERSIEDIDRQLDQERKAWD